MVITIHPKFVRPKAYTPYMGDSKGTDQKMGVWRTQLKAMRTTPSDPMAIGSTTR
jgi:hypothetical protein